MKQKQKFLNFFRFIFRYLVITYWFESYIIDIIDNIFFLTEILLIILNKQNNIIHLRYYLCDCKDANRNSRELETVVMGHKLNIECGPFYLESVLHTAHTSLNSEYSLESLCIYHFPFSFSSIFVSKLPLIVSGIVSLDRVKLGRSWRKTTYRERERVRVRDRVSERVSGGCMTSTFKLFKFFSWCVKAL